MKGGAIDRIANIWFLSHLSGDEVMPNEIDRLRRFLSHLSGDEG